MILFMSQSMSFATSNKAFWKRAFYSAYLMRIEFPQTRGIKQKSAIMLLDSTRSKKPLEILFGFEFK